MRNATFCTCRNTHCLDVNVCADVNVWSWFSCSWFWCIEMRGKCVHVGMFSVFFVMFWCCLRNALEGEEGLWSMKQWAIGPDAKRLVNHWFEWQWQNTSTIYHWFSVWKWDISDKDDNGRNDQLLNACIRKVDRHESVYVQQWGSWIENANAQRLEWIRLSMMVVNRIKDWNHWLF